MFNISSIWILDRVWCSPVQPRPQAPLLAFGNWAVIDAAGKWANHNTKKIQHKAREIDCEQGERLSFFNCLWLAESLRMRLNSLKPILNQEIYFRRASETVMNINLIFLKTALLCGARFIEAKESLENSGLKWTVKLRRSPSYTRYKICLFSLPQVVLLCLISIIDGFDDFLLKGKLLVMIWTLTFERWVIFLKSLFTWKCWLSFSEVLGFPCLTCEKKTMKFNSITSWSLTWEVVTGEIETSKTQKAKPSTKGYLDKLIICRCNCINLLPSKSRLSLS